ncbi:hypothetical protein [Bacillus wiedmannii]|uniref:hypothetical protein n=1 Tax=Bacillus wiedmannii TaxID=1890302 RepID=UPI0015CF568F|nr:hypothetical protein [Bacillus wiedmannii]
MNSLQLGEIYEIFNAYVEMMDKLPARIIVQQLIEQQYNKVSFLYAKSLAILWKW